MVTKLSPQETMEELAAIGIDTSPAPAFAFMDTADDIVYGWHSHSRHQLLYAFSGTLRLEVDRAMYLLPPQRAAWIPAGVQHRTTLNRVRSGAVFFAPALVPHGVNQVRIIPATPLVKEMILYAMRWPVNRDPDDAVANTYFKTLGLLCGEWTREEMPFRLPRAHSPVIAAAMDYTLSNLENVTLDDAARAAVLSPRHLRRRFLSETGISWRQFRLHARMLRAMELLVEPEATITAVAYAVGFNSLSAFAKSFGLFASETPSAYRERIKHPAPVKPGGPAK
jgi:AraC-like DNA-binding protein